MGKREKQKKQKLEETRKYASGTTGEGKLSRRVGEERRQREKKNAKNLIHFKCEETEAQRGQAISPRTPAQWARAARLRPRAEVLGEGVQQERGSKARARRAEAVGQP